MLIGSSLFLLFASTVFGALVTDQLQWTAFKERHGKTYETVDQEQRRFRIFQNNLRTIEQHNALFETGMKTYRMGLNQFSDLTKEEFAQLLKRQHSSKPRQFESQRAQLRDVPIPDSIDWRDTGAVTAVKNQGRCGSCWAFSTVATIESFYFLKNNELVDLSPQQLVDCDNSSAGCEGGEEAPAMEYIQAKGIAKEESYPYIGTDRQCGYNESIVFTKISSYVKLEEKDEDSMVKAVGSLGPISVALDAGDLFLYYSGVLVGEDCAKTYTNHAVLAVGYGHDNATGLDYWLIKNSWGETWGEEGYFKIKRGSNECAIAMDSVYPIL